jgi:hypothetical protein
MPINAMLVISEKGWSEFTDAGSIVTYGRYEAFLSLGAIQSDAEVARIVAEQLAAFADPQRAITAGTAPIDLTDTPYLAYNIGDTIGVPDIDFSPLQERVEELGVTEDPDTGRFVLSVKFAQ